MKQKRWKILITAPYMQPLPEKYETVLQSEGIEILTLPVQERLSEKDLLEWIGDIDGVIAGDDGFTRKVFEKAKKLKVISKWGTGIDSIDQEAAKAHGVQICNTPNAFTLPVADSTLGYILSFARQIPWMDRAMHQGVWRKIPGKSLSELTLGILGVGNIGKAVAQRAKSFGMTLLGHDIVDVDKDFLMVSKKDLLSQADFVSLHCDLNETSYHIIGEAELHWMKPTACLINTARGPLIDEKALVQALQNQQIAGAALDVFEEEPLPLHSPLRQLENVLLSPHNTNSSPKAWALVHENTVRQLINALRRSSL